ncbi:MAG TPA: hypothetical protein VFO44_04435 [Steroidobacteraceae bacterium]|nr:hypothetical protein [Steroidobacteraceae bacterium]
MIEECPDLERFVHGELDPLRFPHREHLRMAFEMLRRHDFAEAAFRYSRALRSMLGRAAKPQAFHQTITIAFLSLIAERMERTPISDFEAFAHANGDLVDKSALARLYRPERLASAAARRTFLLPDGM